MYVENLIIVNLRAVDWSTIRFYTLWAKGHSTKALDFPFINSSIILGCPANLDVLLLATLQYLMC